METRRFRVLVEWDADDEVWVTHVPALGRVSTYGDTRDDALRNTHEAVLGYLEAAALEQLPIPPDDTPFDVVDIEVAAS